MKIKFSKNTLYKVIFIICVAVPYLNNYELTFSIWFLATITTLRKSYSKPLFQQILPFVFILGIALGMCFWYEYKPYNIIRDFAYLLKPILGLLIGYQITKKHLKNPLQTALEAGVVIAIVHLFIVFYCFLFLGVRNIHVLREMAGYFSDYEIYALILIIFNKELEINLSLKNKVMFILLLAISSAFYLSRTNFIQFVILFIALKGYFVWNKRTLSVLLTIFFGTAVFYGTILYINPKRNAPGIEAFLYKIKIAPIEPFKTSINVDDWKDFNDNYRSLENILTVKESLKKDKINIVFGQGLGSVVDIRREVLLDNVMIRYSSILHNGFMTVYLKSGILGVLFLLWSIFILRSNLSNQIRLKSINRLIIGTTIFLFISYWVFMGLYFKADTKSILIGLIFAYTEKKKLEIADENLI